MLSSDPSGRYSPWRRLGLRLVFFCLPIVLAGGALEWWAARVPNVYSLKRERLASCANEVDTLIIGTSGAFYGIAPQKLSGSAFNLAYPAEDMYQYDGVATKVLPLLPKLKRVIIQIDYPVLFYSPLPKTEQSLRQYAYEQECSIPPAQLQDRLDSSMWSRLTLRTPAYYLSLLRKSVQGWMRNGRFVVDDSELDEIDNRGWMIKKEVADLSPALAEERLAWDDTEMNAENESDNVFHLDHLLSMLRQRNIEADFVTLPVWHNYKEGMKPGYWSETQRVVAQRTNNYSVYYYSYLSAPQLESQDFFFDINHLNARGAIRFTELLNSAMNQGKQNSEAKTRLISTNIVK
jgi:hypothetical protein